MNELAADEGALPAAPAPAAAAPVTRFPLRFWLLEGARTLLLRRARWHKVVTGPGTLALFVLANALLNIGIERLYYDGAVIFQWRSILSGWAAMILTAWACYALRPDPQQRADEAVAPSAAYLLTMLLAQSLLLSVVFGLASAALERNGLFERAAPWGNWAAFLLPALWGTVASIVLLIRHGDRVVSQRVQAMYGIALACALTFYFDRPADFWYEKQVGEQQYEPIKFTQDRVENQLPLMEAQLDALAPQRAGVADMYTIVFAPYEGEEVFRRESRVVADVMAKRFDAAGRGVRMINHREHLDDTPWATPLNLQRAIAGIAETMDRDEDVLFIHLTSHGASNGELATSFWPLEVDPVVPEDLKKWLDEAGIRHRVISISACFAGAWVAPLSNVDTLVMTASDADHTSYGCGKKSELTFFGRAMYDEQLRTKTRSFAEAHAAARLIIDQREKEAGKSDGYSNPQISMGTRIGPYLEKLRARLER
ncbi:C13 family peptidase [Massilia sp. CF038]|uniref:C13 family peptidase n=1 Tax=Massilia sp. CF038 TaxID=1881045 RepID=UPI000916E61B|nr:C13 family peptidase [Massilia sp. CF038]SHG99349.1 Peptidase C13 family protein [Massilia sp. CF038]